VDAKIAHVAKFSAGYSKMFPYSNQLIFEGKADVFLLPKFVLVRSVPETTF
jgi:hypothetical protein